MWFRRRRPTSIFPWLILLGTTLLAGVLALSTWARLEREREWMELSLQRQGQTLIRTFEAGARSSLLRRSQMELEGLVQEAFNQGLMAYVVIVNADRQVAAAAGQWEGGLETLPLAAVMGEAGSSRRYSLDSAGQRVLEVGDRFDPLRPPPFGRGRHMQEHFGPKPAVGNLAIFVGLPTAGFDQERRHLLLLSLAQGGGLLLLGTASLVILLLVQRNRVAAATLQNMELYTRNVIDSMPGGLLTVDHDGRIVASNGHLAQMLGLTEPPEGRTLAEILGEGAGELTERLHQRQPIAEQLLELPQADGTPLPLKLSASPLNDREGQPLGMVIVLRDLREIRAMEEQLERSRRHAALGQMAAGIAHEIRNPLGTLRGFAEYFSELRHLDEGAGDYADLMIEEVDRLGRNVSALLQYSRPREPEIQPVPLEPLLRKALRLVEGDAASRQVALELAPLTPEAELEADPDLLLQVLLNLLHNALAACTPGASIRLEFATDNGEALLTVRDSGAGMIEEVRQRMFDPFFTTRKEGTGLGLAVVHQIIEQHSGRIEVDSAPGAGTAVRLRLPQRRKNG